MDKGLRIESKNKQTCNIIRYKYIRFLVYTKNFVHKESIIKKISKEKVNYLDYDSVLEN